MAKYEISVPDESTNEFVRKLRDILQAREPEEGGQKITLADAATHIFTAGISRVRATTKYALRKAGKLAPYKKPEKKAKPAPVKKAATPKKAKAAKGPLARKAKAAAKAKPPRVVKPAASKIEVVKDTPAPAVAATAEPVLD